MVEERDLPPRAVEATAKTRDKRDKFDNFMPIRRMRSAPLRGSGLREFNGS